MPFRPKTLLLHAFIIFTLSSFSRPLNAANHYVDSAIRTSGDGTSWGRAWKFFSRINWGAVQAGDTIYISGGSRSQTYTETLMVGISGTLGRPIVLTGGMEAGHNGSVIIDGRDILSYGVHLSNRNHVVVKKLHIRNTLNAGIRVTGATAGVLIEDNDIYTGNGRGLDFRSNRGMSPAIARANRITTPTNTIGQTDGIWTFDNDGVIFENNSIVISNRNINGHSDGIQSYLDYSVTIRNNWIEQNNTATTDNHGLWLENTKNGGVLRVYNNVILTPNLTADSAVTHWARPTWNETGTIRIWNNTIKGGQRVLNLDKTPNAEIKNNILWPSAGGHAIYMVNGRIPAANINNNLIWAPSANVAAVNERTWTWSQWQSLGYDQGGVSAEPRFNNLAAKDVTLLGTSPAIDRGRMLSELRHDRVGTRRPQGLTYDIGAYEHVTAR